MAGKSLYKRLDKEEINNIINDYKNNMSLRSLEKKYSYSRKALSKLLEEAGVKTTKGNHYRKYFHDEDFFETIDTEEKAYWLGFMFADGYILNHDNRYGQDKFGLALAEQDRQSIEDFKKAIKATNPITEDHSRNRLGQQTQCRLLMTSQKTVNDLIEKGCVKQKSLILKPPIGVPEELLHHFLRGFFDGDGSILRCPKKNSTYISFFVEWTTTKEVAEWIFSFFGFGRVNKEYRRDYSYYYRTNSNPQSIKVYHYLYDDATVYMKRKYDKFQELLAKYDENRGN